MIPLHPNTLAALRNRLLRWFYANQRSLPWRADRDPYRIWVSEVMLQQTTVAAVIPYFERFIRAFPNLRALARADEQEVLKLWEGLGYYRRARHLHAAARRLADEHGGVLPDNPDLWAALPGVGRYIRGAVLSQAFDRKLPIVEANSLRVLTRLFGYRGDPRSAAGQAWVWSAAEAVLPSQRAGDFNQALMELGSQVCTASAPRCDRCPVAKWCVARRNGLQELIPLRKEPAAVQRVAEVGIVICKRGRVLLCRRRADAQRWQNMWETPHGERLAGEETAPAALRIVREQTGLQITPGAEVLTIKHGVTRFAITLVCIEAELRGGSFKPGYYTEAKWVKPADLVHFPVSSPQRKLMTHLADSMSAGASRGSRPKRG